MKDRFALICLGIAAFAYGLAGCNTGTITEAQQDAKVKAMDDIAKSDPHYADKRAAHGGGR